MKLPASHIGNLFSYASFKGIKEAELRKHLTQPSLDVCSLENTVSDIEFLSIFEHIIKADGSDYAGLNYGCYLNIKALRLISQITLSASTIAQAVFILQQYFDSAFPLIELKAIENKKQYVMQLECSVKDKILSQHLLDAVYCFVYRELRLMVSDDLLLQLFMPTKDASACSLFLNAEVKKGKSHSLVFDRNVLEVEINAKRAKQIELLLPQFLKMLDKNKTGYKLLSVQVRNMILNMCCPELPSFEQVLAQFPISSRTFQRKLRGENISFRKITDDIKKELSTYLVKGNKMKTQDIAYLLGYSESSAYLHAVKKWKLNSE
jgi:AraC-like DNA-binding protein